MAKIPMVTRTIITTKCILLCLNTETQEACNIEVVLSGTYPDKDKMLKACKKVAETDVIKPVQVVSSEEQETLYGMTEQQFIVNATILPPRQKKEVIEKEASNN